jgi:hypothetical protein
MLFLIEYDRRRGEIINMSTHQDEERALVDAARLQMELWLRQGRGKREVVVLEAANEEALRKTYAQYFKSANALVPAGITTRKSR